MLELADGEPVVRRDGDDDCETETEPDAAREKDGEPLAVDVLDVVSEAETDALSDAVAAGDVETEGERDATRDGDAAAENDSDALARPVALDERDPTTASVADARIVVDTDGVAELVLVVVDDDETDAELELVLDELGDAV